MKSIAISSVLMVVTALAIGCGDDEPANDDGVGGGSGAAGPTSANTTASTGAGGNMGGSDNLDQTCQEACINQAMTGFPLNCTVNPEACFDACQAEADMVMNVTMQCEDAFQEAVSDMFDCGSSAFDCDEHAQCFDQFLAVLDSPACTGGGGSGCTFDCSKCTVGVDMQCRAASDACESNNMGDPQGLQLCCDSVATTYSAACP